MPDAAELAFKNLEKVLSRDPMLRDVLEQTIPKSKKGGRFTPDVDVTDMGDKYMVLLDLPGVAKEQLKIELQGTKLIVHGEKPNLHPKGGQPVSSERPSGSFKRVFLLPAQVLADGVTADLTLGVLRIDIPKVGDGASTTIPIR